MTKRLKAWLRKRLSPTAILRIHKLRAVAACFRYGFPARGLLVVGVTGTKGKTTTSYFMASILREAGYKVGVATTVSFSIGDKTWTNESNKSSLPPFQLQKLLRDMRRAGCNALVIEVTSHALEQSRVWGIPFRYVGLTNITHDHLDYHKTWASYQQAKLKLFKWRSLKGVVVNAADPSAELFLTTTKARQRWAVTAGDESIVPNVTDWLVAEKISTNPAGSTFALTAGANSKRVTLQIPGRFNIENALVASGICLAAGIPLEKVATGLESMDRVPGRLERIDTKKGFQVIVDYAHTSDSLEKLYSTLRPDVRGRMIAVLGATGDRDTSKRPIMGSLAARFCDFVFVTDEEPYTEDPLAIINEVAKGVPRGRALFKSPSPKAQRQERPILKKDNESGENEWWWKVADRREAISRAIDMGKLDDLILVTGMGAQNFKIVGDQKVAWNDRTIIEELLTEKGLL